MDIKELTHKYRDLAYSLAEIDECESEPYSHCGAIFPFGLLFVIQKEDWKILGISRNWLQLTEQKQINNFIGKSVLDYLALSCGAPLTSELILNNTDGPRTIPVQLQKTKTPTNGNLRILTEGDHYLFEMQFTDKLTGSAPSGFQEILNSLVISTDPEQVCQNWVDTVLQQTPYDRCLVYRFDRSAHGEVIAESLAVETPTLLNHKFPSGDVPKSCRKMSLQIQARIIADVHALPEPIIGAGFETKDLDLTQCSLRFSSPFHLQYLKNMGVRSALTLPLKQADKLWGMVSFHKLQEPIHPAEDLTSYLIASTRLLASTLLDLNVAKQQRIKTKIFQELSQKNQLPEILESISDFLKKLQISSSVCLKIGSQEKVLGDAPPKAFKETVVQAIIEQKKSGIWSTDCLNEDLGVEYHSKACGAMIIPFSFNYSDYILWFRKEEISEIKWAGKPSKHARSGSKSPESLLPRNSFALWVDDTRKCSRPWSEDDLDIANYFLCAFIQWLLTRLNALNRKLSHAERQTKFKDIFIGKISHELRTPLAVARGWLDILRSDEADLQMKQEAYQIVEKNLDSQLKLIEDLLDTSRIASGKMQMKIQEKVHLSSLLSEILSNATTLAKEKDLSVYCSYFGDLRVDVDAERIKQAVMNLLTNSVKFSPSGKSIFVEIEENEQSFSIVVKDQGAGIHSSQLTKIFDEFHQSDFVCSKNAGLGLGLSIVRAIVQKHHGKIEIESPGKDLGTTIRLVLPIHQPDQSAQSATWNNPSLQKNRGQEPSQVPNLQKTQNTKTTQQTIGNFTGKSFLVAEDNIEMLRIVTAILQNEGGEVRAVNNGLVCLEEWQSNQYDLLISDIGMPEMDGISLIKSVRAEEWQTGRKATPAIALSAFASNTDRDLAVASGFQQFVCKPVKKNDLIEIIQSLLQSD